MILFNTVQNYSASLVQFRANDPLFINSKKPISLKDMEVLTTPVIQKTEVKYQGHEGEESRDIEYKAFPVTALVGLYRAKRNIPLANGFDSKLVLGGISPYSSRKQNDISLMEEALERLTQLDLPLAKVVSSPIDYTKRYDLIDDGRLLASSIISESGCVKDSHYFYGKRTSFPNDKIKNDSIITERALDEFCSGEKPVEILKRIADRK